MNQRQRESINNFMVSRFSVLRHMYKVVAEEAKLERDIQLYNDWLEWSELDDECKQYVLDFLKN